MRKIMMVAVGVVAALAISACGLEEDPDGDGAVVVGDNGSDAPAADGEGDSGSDEAVGTRDNPLEPGVAFEIGEWVVQFGETNTDADEVVAAENEFNEPPVDGRRFVMAEVSLSYVGDTSGEPWLDLTIEFSGAGGNTFDGTGEADYCGLVPNDLIDVGEMFPDASASGNVCMSVPTDQIEGGAWMVEDTWGISDTARAFVALQ